MLYLYHLGMSLKIQFGITGLSHLLLFMTAGSTYSLLWDMVWWDKCMNVLGGLYCGGKKKQHLRLY